MKRNNVAITRKDSNKIINFISEGIKIKLEYHAINIEIAIIGNVMRTIRLINFVQYLQLKYYEE